MMQAAVLSMLLALASAHGGARAEAPPPGGAPIVLAAGPVEGAVRRLAPDLDALSRLDRPLVTAVPRAVLVAVPLQPFSPRSDPGAGAPASPATLPGSGALAALAMVVLIVARRRH
jgi:hypothetical protein